MPQLFFSSPPLVCLPLFLDVYSNSIRLCSVRIDCNDILVMNFSGLALFLYRVHLYPKSYYIDWMVFWLLVLLNQGFLCGSTINQCPGRTWMPHWREMRRWHFINDLRLQQIRPPFIFPLYCCYFLNLPRSRILGVLLPHWHSCQDVPQSEQVFTCCGLIWAIKINFFGRVPEIGVPC